MQVQAYSAVLLACRKLLAHVAVDKGASPNKPFAFYIDYLAEHHWIPPTAGTWVKPIKDYGNQATHEIYLASLEDGSLILEFSYFLLMFMYELPSRVSQGNESAT